MSDSAVPFDSPKNLTGTNPKSVRRSADRLDTTRTKTRSTFRRPIRRACLTSWITSSFMAFVVVYPLGLLLLLAKSLLLDQISLIEQITLPAFVANEPQTLDLALWSIVALVGLWLTYRLHHWIASPFYGRVRRTWREVQWWPHSVRGILNTQRGGLVLLATFVLFAEIATAMLERWATLPHRLEGRFVLAGVILPTLFGLRIWWKGTQTYENCRGRHARRWHHAREDGLAIVDFTPAWDHPDKPVFAGCRASRRLAMAHTSIRLSTASCFAFAGTIATQSASATHLAQATVYFSVALILTQWPTTERLVAWCCERVARPEVSKPPREFR